MRIAKKKNGTKIGTTTKIDSAIVLPPLCFSIYLVLYSGCVYFSIGSRPTYAENAVMKKKQKKTHAVRFAILMATHRQFIHSFHSFNDRNTSRMSFAQTRQFYVSFVCSYKKKIVPMFILIAVVLAFTREYRTSTHSKQQRKKKNKS